MSAVLSRVDIERTLELEAALKDIALGCEMMLQPGVATGAFSRFAEEVRRVALAAITHRPGSAS